MLIYVVVCSGLYHVVLIYGVYGNTNVPSMSVPAVKNAPMFEPNSWSNNLNPLVVTIDGLGPSGKLAAAQPDPINMK